MSVADTCQWDTGKKLLAKKVSNIDYFIYKTLIYLLIYREECLSHGHQTQVVLPNSKPQDSFAVLELAL